MPTNQLSNIADARFQRVVRGLNDHYEVAYTPGVEPCAAPSEFGFTPEETEAMTTSLIGRHEAVESRVAVARLDRSCDAGRRLLADYLRDEAKYTVRTRQRVATMIVFLTEDELLVDSLYGDPAERMA